MGEFFLFVSGLCFWLTPVITDNVGERLKAGWFTSNIHGTNRITVSRKHQHLEILSLNADAYVRRERKSLRSVKYSGLV